MNIFDTLIPDRNGGDEVQDEWNAAIGAGAPST